MFIHVCGIAAFQEADVCMLCCAGRNGPGGMEEWAVSAHACSRELVIHACSVAAGLGDTNEHLL